MFINASAQNVSTVRPASPSEVWWAAYGLHWGRAGNTTPSSTEVAIREASVASPLPPDIEMSDKMFEALASVQEAAARVLATSSERGVGPAPDSAFLSPKTLFA